MGGLKKHLKKIVKEVEKGVKKIDAAATRVENSTYRHQAGEIENNVEARIKQLEVDIDSCIKRVDDLGEQDKTNLEAILAEIKEDYTSKIKPIKSEIEKRDADAESLVEEARKDSIRIDGKIANVYRQLGRIEGTTERSPESSSPGVLFRDAKNGSGEEQKASDQPDSSSGGTKLKQSL